MPSSACQPLCRPRGRLAASRQPEAAAAMRAAPFSSHQRWSGGTASGGPPALLWRPDTSRPSRAATQPLVRAVARPMGPLDPERAVQLEQHALERHEHAAEQHPAASSVRQVLDGYYRLLRGWNVLPSAALVLLGAWAGAGKTLLALQGITVWFMAWASGAVAMASCAINDYFDWRIDELNDASKPIPSGLIPPDKALLCACALYIALLALACTVPNAGVRLIVAASCALTVLYTPLFKRRTLLKNCVVATTIAAAPLAGALAAGAAGPGLRCMAAPTAYLFMSILHREILMDIADRNGDRASGVPTLPVVLGARASLAICAALLGACAALGVHAALAGRGLAWAWGAHPAWEPGMRTAALAAVAWAHAPSAAAIAAILRSGFGRPQLSHAITLGLRSAGLGTLLLAALL